MLSSALQPDSRNASISSSWLAFWLKPIFWEARSATWLSPLVHQLWVIHGLTMGRVLYIRLPIQVAVLFHRTR